MDNITKGEWKAIRWTRDKDCSRHGFNIWSGDNFIASVPLDSPPHTMVETKTNAHLIAAAPNQNTALVHCVAIMASLKPNDNVSQEDIDDVLIEAKGALDKAEGK